MTTINGRTPDEIKKGLELCIGNSDLSEDYCEKCPYIPDASCRDTLEIDALALIQQYENHIGELTEKVQQLERERDAAVGDLETMGEDRAYCGTCLHNNADPKEEPCNSCMAGYLINNWQWRGVQEVE